MAVPDSVNIRDMNGTYALNKTLSDDSSKILKMQGIGWLVRQAVAYSNITVTLKQYTDDAGKVNIDIDQVSSGGLRSKEERVLDWEWREKEDGIFGKLKGQTRFIPLADVEDDYLKQGWVLDTPESEVVENYVESLKDTWTARQVWGFAEVNGKRCHVRRILAKKGTEEHRIRMVYDWKSQ